MSLEVIEEEIKSLPILEPKEFDIEILENQSGKVVQLLNTTEQINYKLKNQYYTFKFKEPIFVQKIIFHTLGESNLKDMELMSIDFQGNSSSINFSSNEYSVWIPNKMLKAFKFKAPKRIHDKITLTNIDIVGFTLNDLSTVKNQLNKVTSYKETLDELVEEIKSENKALEEKTTHTENILNEKQESIKEKETTINELNQSINSLSEKKENSEKTINEIAIKKESLEKENTKLSNNVIQLEDSTNTLNKEISNQRNELKKLIEDKNIFSTEMKEYIQQGNKDIKLYTGLSIIPWIIIAVVSGLVFWGSSDLTTIYNPAVEHSNETIDINAIFWSRMPFVLIVISILLVSYEISKIFIKNIIHIHKQKRIFTKIGIVAKDVADQSVLGLNISEQDKFDLRTKLKMDLLKSHLKNDIGENYEYHIKTSLWDFFKNPNKKNDREEERD